MTVLIVIIISTVLLHFCTINAPHRKPSNFSYVTRKLQLAARWCSTKWNKKSTQQKKNKNKKNRIKKKTRKESVCEKTNKKEKEIKNQNRHPLDPIWSSLLLVWKAESRMWCMQLVSWCFEPSLVYADCLHLFIHFFRNCLLRLSCSHSLPPLV